MSSPTFSLSTEEVTPESLEGFKGHALVHVNTVRQHLGFPPIEELCSGRMRNGIHCSLAESINQTDLPASGIRAIVGPLFTSVIDLETGESVLHENNPSQVARFVVAFDMGYMPELVNEEK